MSKNLVIVESPAKAKTIERILGKKYEVVASYGHVRDLPKSKLAVDIEHNFEPHYTTIKGKGDVLKRLRNLAKKADKIYLASDPDREGEAIAWHLCYALSLDEKEKNRIAFNEITETAIKNSIKKPRSIDLNMVNAQQARRILDRLVGYGISPLLWKSISSKTSAGRVQSVALKIICDLEKKIKSFKSEKYWEIKGDFENNLILNLNKIDNEKIDKVFDEKIVKKIETLKNNMFLIASAEINRKTKNPPLPLKTSTLQQLASSYLGYTPSRTMRIAQGLYEGIDIKGEHKGLITYMRTDSTRISEDAKKMAIDYIVANFGKEYLGKERIEKNKQNIQDAHEGIRPTDIKLTPEILSKYLDKDQLKLYKLIWERFLISQFAAMKYDQFELIVTKDKYSFRGTKNKIIFYGYYKIFKDSEELELGAFPDLKKGDLLKLNNLIIKEDFTKPPARFTESSLIKKLETEGIGRPSTYATIIDTLKKREYVETNSGKSLIPTSLGEEVETKLVRNFQKIMEIKFTANLETQLDEVAEGNKNWISLLKDFNNELSAEIAKYAEIVEKEAEKIIISDVECSCGAGKMILKSGRFGRYLACPSENPCKNNISLRGINIPQENLEQGEIFVKKDVEKKIQEKLGQKTDMKTANGSMYLLKYGRFGSYLESENFQNDNDRLPLPTEIRKMLAMKQEKIENGIVLLKNMFDKIKFEEDEIIKSAGLCEKCGKPFKIQRGRWGKFLACTGYPDCKNIKKIKK